jgi:hypothetical protein
MPDFGISQIMQPKKTAANPCDNGCEVTLGALKRTNQYFSKDTLTECTESVYALPTGWLADGLFLHVRSCVYTAPAYKAGQRYVGMTFAETARQGDIYAALGQVIVSGSTSEGMVRDPAGTPWKLTVRNPNFGGAPDLNALTLHLEPLVPHY